MKFARKLIHGGPVHHFHEPVEVLQWSWFTNFMGTSYIWFCFYDTKNTICWSTETKNKKQTRTKLKGRALHWPNYHIIFTFQST